MRTPPKQLGTITIALAAVTAACTLPPSSIHDVNVTQDETWTKADSPHLVEGVIAVDGPGTPTLTIEAGAEVRFARNAGLVVAPGEGGAIRILGTEKEPVRFTSDAAFPTRGDWTSLTIEDRAGASRIEWAVFEYCGNDDSSSYEDACVVVNGNSQKVPFSHVTVRESFKNGVGLNNAEFGAGSTHLHVEKTNAHPLYIGGDDASTIPPNSTWAENGRPQIVLASGTVERTQTWANHGLPYVALEDLWIGAESGTPVLTIAPGVEIRMQSGKGIGVGESYGGELKAEGTAEEKIRFTVDAAQGEAGQWVGLLFGPYSTSASKLSHAIVEFGGGESASGWAEALVQVVDEKGAFITNTAFRHSAACGVSRSEYDAMPTTDFTAAALGNTFEAIAGEDQCGPE